MAVSKAQQRAVAKYAKNNYDRLELKVKKGNKEVIEKAARNENKSLNGYILEAVNEKLIKSSNPSILDTPTLQQLEINTKEGD